MEVRRKKPHFGCGLVAPSPTRGNRNVHGRAAWERFCDWSDMRGYRKKMSGSSSGGHPRSGRSPLR